MITRLPRRPLLRGYPAEIRVFQGNWKPRQRPRAAGGRHPVCGRVNFDVIPLIAWPGEAAAGYACNAATALGFNAAAGFQQNRRIASKAEVRGKIRENGPYA